MHLTADADPVEATARLRAVMETMLHAAQDAYPQLRGDDLKYVPARLGGTAPTPQEAQEIEEREAAEKAARRAARG